jgi:hypothetical protein
VTDAIHTLETEGWRLRCSGGEDLLVGPGGAFLLATREVPGRASVEGGVLTARLGDDDETVVRYGGLRGRLVAAARRIGPDVRPMVVVHGDFPRRALDDDGVAYVHADELVACLRAHAYPLPLAS